MKATQSVEEHDVIVEVPIGDGPMDSLVCAEAMRTTTRVDSILDTTELNSSVGTKQQWIQSISDLTSEEEGDYFVDRLSRRWTEEDLGRSIDALKDDLWDIFNGKHFKHIEISKVLQQHASEVRCEKEKTSKNYD